MRKLLTAPVKMSLSASENTLYQTCLKHAAEISLNLMAVKVEHYPTNFLDWLKQLLFICQHKVNRSLLDPKQEAPLKKLEQTLNQGISYSQLKLLRLIPWPIFVGFAQENKQSQCLAERLRLLEYIKQLKTTPLAALSELDRLVIAGKHSAQHQATHYNFDSEWFAGTKYAKEFHLLWQQQPQLFDAALAHIPLEGDIELNHYQLFTKAYRAIFEQANLTSKMTIAPATRLLAMRRPDFFIALSNQNITVFCYGMSLNQIDKNDFEGYWHDILVPTHHCAWWRQSEPTEDDELLLWQNRAILVDLFFAADEKCQPSTFKNQSAKPRSSANISSRSKKNIGDLVDEALQDESLPEYMKGKRTFIINEVNKGKTITEVISLCRAIFG